MPDVVSAVSGIGKALSLTFKGIAWMGRKFVDWLVDIRATDIQLLNGVVQPILPDERVTLPAGTNEFHIRGRYWCHPANECYFVFVRIGEAYWPQERLMFENKRWSARVTVGASGSQHIIVGKATPEIQSLFNYYWDVVDRLQVAKQLIAKSDIAHLSNSVDSCVPVTISGRLSGLVKLQVIELHAG